VRLILQHMTDESCALLALNAKTTRPENFVLTMLVVPPPIVRPSITISEGSRARGQDDLTAKLCDIVKANAAVKQVLEKEAASIPKNGLSIAAQQTVGDLAFHVSTFMNNELRGQRQAMQRSGLPSKSITSRLKGKEGRIRGSLMGKRVNFSARSVVSPDSQMDIDQVGVPVRVAVKLTVPEKTTDWNVDRLRACIRRGPRQLRGAHALIRGSSTTLLEFADLEKEAKTLKIGDVVERFLMDDDIVLFNRQPSLHKGSMMSYRVRIMPHKTFRLNMAVTLPLNADCDGDELNVHVPQDEESQTEARLLMAVPCQILSPQANKPCIGFMQDAVIGSWLLTREGTVVRRPLAVALWASIKHHRPALPVQAVYSGRQIYSLLFPGDLHYWNPKAGVTIRAGQLVQGTLCKITLGATSGGIVHFMYLSHGPQRTAEFLSDAQRLVNRWLATRGFSIRLSDCEPDAATREKVEMTIRLAEQKFKRIQQAGAVSGLPEATREAALSDIANRVLTDVGKVVHASLDDNANALYQAVLCASKGNLINVAQLLGCIGQTSVEGRRIFVADEQRQFGAPGTLSKCGFVANSYFSGLNSVEFFFHTMAGREGLIDTAVKTANTGYLQRRLMKAMETLTISYDRTVRNARKNIVQFLYGADSYDATHLVRQALTCLETPTGELRTEFATEKEWEAFWPCLAEVRQHRCRPQGEIDNLVYAPGSVSDVLHMLAGVLGPDVAERTALSPDEHLDLLNAFCDECCPTQWGRRSGYESILRWNLRFSHVQKLGRQVFLAALAEMRRRTLCSLVAPGEAVGALSAQSISEPLTQLTLNSVDWNTTMAIHWTGRTRPPRPRTTPTWAPSSTR
jgi:DNA-directed RNA polymerase II subunit RPB1